MKKGKGSNGFARGSRHTGRECSLPRNDWVIAMGRPAFEKVDRQMLKFTGIRNYSEGRGRQFWQARWENSGVGHSQVRACWN